MFQWVRDDDERSVKAAFKWHLSAEGMYALGMERVAYVLGERLDLPVPATFLDEFNGRQGCAQVFIPGPPWEYVEASTSWLLDMFQNADAIPLAVVFDLWMANPDRHRRNLLVRPEPPGRKPGNAAASTLWLIDHERCGLWPPQGKFGAAKVEEVDVPGDGRMSAQAEGHIADQMPVRYRRTFEGLCEADRTPLLDRIRTLDDDAIDEAVHEIPDNYMSETARERTVALLRARRDNIGTLADAVFNFPAPNRAHDEEVA